MHRVDTTTAAVSLPAPDAPGAPGFFHQGNPLTGTPATVPGYAWFNAVQEEITYVIEQAGIALDKADRTQLKAAIAAMIAAGTISAYDIPFNAGFTAIMTGQDLAVQVYGEMVAARAFTAVGASGYIDTVATGAAVIVDILKNGTTIWITKPQFAASANAMTAGVLKSDGTQIFAAADRLTFSVTQVGSTILGQKLRFTLKGTA